MRYRGAFGLGAALCALAGCGTSYEGEPTVTYERVGSPTVMTVPAPATAPAACDLGRHVWVQRSAGVCGGSTWRFVRMSDGTWRGVESGCSNATGSAAYNGSVLSMRFADSRSAGVYTWPVDGACRSGPGSVRWTAGDLTGRTTPSTLIPAR